MPSGIKEANPRPLTLEKWKRVIDEWMNNGYDPIKAYQSVYPTANNKSARDAFSAILKRPDIKEYYEERKKDLLLLSGITQEHILQEMGEMAFSELREDNPVTAQTKYNSLKALLDWTSRDVLEQSKSSRTVKVTIEE